MRKIEGGFVTTVTTLPGVSGVGINEVVWDRCRSLIYLVDFLNNCVHTVDPMNSYAFSKLAGNGITATIDNAVGLSASFYRPEAAAISKDCSTLFVTERHAVRQILLDSPDHTAKTIAGTGSASGSLTLPVPALEASLTYVRGV